MNTSLGWKRREMVARLRVYCVPFWEEKRGNVGAVNDLCVICVAPVRVQKKKKAYVW